MNVFMGYNPLAGKQVKITTFNYEVDGDGADPLDPQYGDCMLHFADSIAEQEGEYDEAYTFDGDDWTELGGGGIVYPTFTPTGGSVTCDMTFAEIKANYQASDMKQWGIAVWVHPAPVYGKGWVGITLISGSFLDNYEEVPETVSEGFELFPVGGTKPLALYADDDNFYFPKH